MGYQGVSGRDDGIRIPRRNILLRRAVKDKWARTVDRRNSPGAQTVEEFMGIVSRSWANAEVISITETGERMTVIMRAEAWDDGDDEE